jgi:hypothetical protein
MSVQRTFKVSAVSLIVKRPGGVSQLSVTRLGTRRSASGSDTLYRTSWDYGASGQVKICHCSPSLGG